jgi:hypothetical protein
VEAWSRPTAQCIWPGAPIDTHTPPHTKSSRQEPRTHHVHTCTRWSRYTPRSHPAPRCYSTGPKVARDCCSTRPEGRRPPHGRHTLHTSPPPRRRGSTAPYCPQPRPLRSTTPWQCPRSPCSIRQAGPRHRPGTVGHPRPWAQAGRHRTAQPTLPHTRTRAPWSHTPTLGPGTRCPGTHTHTGQPRCRWLWRRAWG